MITIHRQDMVALNLFFTGSIGTTFHVSRTLLMVPRRDWDEDAVAVMNKVRRRRDEKFRADGHDPRQIDWHETWTLHTPKTDAPNETSATLSGN